MSKVHLIDFFSKDDAFYHERAQSVFCSPAWVRILQKTYDFDCFAAIEPSSKAYFPYIQVDNFMGNKLVSLPFSDYTDLNTDTPEKYTSLIQALQLKHSKQSLVLKTTNSTDALGDANLWGEQIRKAYYHRIATGNIEEIKKKQSSNFKRNKAKAEKNGLSIQIKRDATALRQFYRLYYRLRINKFRSIPQPYSFFENVFDEFIAKDQGFIVEAIYENRTIASIVVLRYKKVLFYKFGASDVEHLELRPNNLIFDQLIMYAHKNGFDEVDLGLSGVGDAYKGLVRFKESMGGVASNIVYYQKGNKLVSEQQKQQKTWLSALTDEIVASQTDIDTISKLSSLIYPLFA